ncbi:MAG: septal ring factor EnvC (AmiA/AmiB activator) [Verrucomicrobiales bacterium]|jgi:septal ring factor EnvC (AmiA/AmiB activator)
MATLVSGTYQNGAVVLDEPVDWQEKTAVRVAVVDECEPDHSADGPSPKTPEDMEAWCKEIEEMSPLFEASDQLEQFEKRLADAKEEQKRLTAQSWETADNLFE